MKVYVKSVPETGFYRLGKKFTREATELEVTDKELAILEAEKMLVVVRADGKKQGGDDKGGAPKK